MNISNVGNCTVLTGCSGGGKSTLIAELARRGYATFPEAGRQIVREEMLVDGPSLPWKDMEAFAQRCFERALSFVQSARQGEATFFDRSMIEPVTALERMGREVPSDWHSAVERHRYNRLVFFAPPWRAIFRQDRERRHSFEQAVTEAHALRAAYLRAGYDLVDLPKTSVARRADFVLTALAQGTAA